MPSVRSNSPKLFKHVVFASLPPSFSPSLPPSLAPWLPLSLSLSLPPSLCKCRRNDLKSCAELLSTRQCHTTQLHRSALLNSDCKRPGKMQTQIQEPKRCQNLQCNTQITSQCGTLHDLPPSDVRCGKPKLPLDGAATQHECLEYQTRNPIENEPRIQLADVNGNFEQTGQSTGLEQDLKQNSL